jgi:hypothetical protein
MRWATSGDHHGLKRATVTKKWPSLPDITGRFLLEHDRLLALADWSLWVRRTMPVQRISPTPTANTESLNNENSHKSTTTSPFGSEQQTRRLPSEGLSSGAGR